MPAFLCLESRGFNATRSFYFDVHHLTTFLDNLTTMQHKLEVKLSY